MSKAQALIGLLESGLSNYNRLIRAWHQLTDVEQEDLTIKLAKSRRKEKGDMFATSKEMEYILDDPLGYGDFVAKEAAEEYNKKRNLVMKMDRQGKKVTDPDLIDMLKKYSGSTGDIKNNPELLKHYKKLYPNRFKKF